MAEILDSKPAEEEVPKAHTSEPASEFDPKTMRRTKPGVKRLTISVTVLISFILGFPLLWKSIEIYRAPLPFDRIDSFSSQIESSPLHFPCSFRAIFAGFDFRVSAGDVADEIKERMSELSPGDSRCGCGAADYSVLAVLDWGSDFGGKLRGGDDEDADELVKNVLSEDGHGKVYSVVVVNGEEGEEVRAVVGKYRHAWIVGRVSEEEAVSHVAEIFAKVFVNGGSEGGSIRGEFMPVGADGRIVLSFSLLNADPRDWIYDWYE